MPTPLRFFIRPGAVGIALTAYDVWRRIPPTQRRALLHATRRHGPRVAAAAARGVQEAARRRRENRPR